MSIQIDWQRLIEDAEVVENRLKEFLDEQFQRIDLPPFIQSLSVSSFKLGGIPPEITIRHISDPFPEFYEEEEDSDTDGETTSHSSKNTTPTPKGHGSLKDPSKRLRASRLMSPVSEIPTKPFGRTSTPSGSLNYFPHNHGSQPNELSTAANDISQIIDEQDGFEPAENSESIEQESFEDLGLDETYSPLDAQMFVELRYAGDTQLGVAATLLVNYPAPGFISLPLEFKITGLEIHSLAVIAYIKKRVHLSILCDIDGNDQMSSDDVKVITQLNMESKIGDHGENGAVLRNVSKVEQFILEQLRRVLRDELVWPGWITLEL